MVVMVMVMVRNSKYSGLVKETKVGRWEMEVEVELMGKRFYQFLRKDEKRIWRRDEIDEIS